MSRERLSSFLSLLSVDELLLLDMVFCSVGVVSISSGNAGGGGRAFSDSGNGGGGGGP